MTEEDEEFNRIERESHIRKETVLQALHNENERLGLYKSTSREQLMAEVAVLTELVRVLSDRVAELEAKRTWVGLTWNDVPDEWVGKVAFVEGAKWADKQLKEKNT